MASDYQLHDVIHLTENVKSVVKTAERINLLALNAILLAERAGRSAAGFGVVSGSLRQLCLTLTARMKTLDEINHQLLSDISTRYKEQRFFDLMERATQGGHSALEQAKTLQRQQDADTRMRMQLNNKRLRREATAARELCERGLAMVHSAKIESVYGGVFSAQLMDVACAFAEHMGCMLPNLKQLQEGAATHARPGAAA